MQPARIHRECAFGVGRPAEMALSRFVAATASVLAKDLSQQSDPFATSPNTFLAFAASVQMPLLSCPI